jgi:hypothetical protein
MKRLRWRRRWLAATAATGVVIGGVWADPPPAPETVILLREPGKPDRKCIIERTTSQADGTLVHELRDANTGEKFRVNDSRSHKGLLGQPAPAKSSEPPLANPLPPRRLPTTAELAGYATPPVTPGETVSPLSGVLRRTKPAGTLSPVKLQMQKLKEATEATEREMAAMMLALSDARNTPEVIDALMTSAKSDQVASVRVCLVRCLYRLAVESPQVVPVIQQLQADTDDEVSRTAQLAIQQLGKN